MTCITTLVRITYSYLSTMHQAVRPFVTLSIQYDILVKQVTAGGVPWGRSRPSNHASHLHVNLDTTAAHGTGKLCKMAVLLLS